MLHRKQVCTRAPLSKDKFQLKLSESWSRIVAHLDGQLNMASAMGERDTAAIKRGIGATNLPEAHKIFNSLLAHPSALDEIMSEYGFRLVPVSPEAANDLHTAAGLLDGASELIRAQDDGRRDHQETLKVADKLRPYLPAAIAIVEEADAIRGRG